MAPRSMGTLAILLLLATLGCWVCLASGQGHGGDDVPLKVLISSVVKSNVKSVASIAVELYNPSCSDVQTRMQGMELALLYCGGRGSSCITKQARLHGHVRKLRTFVVCSSTSPSLLESDRCDLSLGDSLAEDGKRLIEVKLLASNGTQVVDSLRDEEAFSSEAFTMKKFSESVQPKEKRIDDVREMSSIWLYKPYSTFSLLGCHSTRHEMECKDALPETCPPADIDSFRTFTVGDLADRLRCAGGNNATCVSSLHGETVSTIGFVGSKMDWFAEDHYHWLLTLAQSHEAHGGKGESLRVAIKVPADEANRMKASWVNGMRVGSKVSMVGQLSSDEYGVLMENVLTIDTLDWNEAAQKVLPDDAPSGAIGDQAESRSPSEPGETTPEQSPGFISRETLDTFAIVAIAMCSIFIIVGSALLIFIQYRKSTNPRSICKLNHQLG
ncbi:hypothetical protein HOP50_08g52620 [Chloropicon primus]|nr:hypothetical protein A3770_08p52320 [Chloropicon primus]UPR01938.1 hypothetical protein HOP50_08g52620 [Chloropicon primus]|eukprot:QDZ22714.1 hypothetical protein A3770_08p52320 [Chloropicon primus]